MLGHLQPLVAGLLAALLAWAGAPLAARAARRTGFVDRPSTPLDQHAEPTPYLGGLAVFVPFLAAAALVFELDAAFLGILLAATLAALLGLMDDFGAMRPGVKMIGQLVIILVLLRAGVRIDLEALPLWLNLALTAFWLLALTESPDGSRYVDFLESFAGTWQAQNSPPFRLEPQETHTRVPWEPGPTVTTRSVRRSVVA